MNYRHAFHAGNFADIHKHLALVSILGRLLLKETPFAVIDVHAGCGLYDLSSAESRKTGEAAQGIGKIANHVAQTALLARYLEVVRAFGPDIYPGSPVIAARLMHAQDRLVAIEREPLAFQGLKSALNGFGNAHAREGDGYDELRPLLPPSERRGLVLIDPPFENPGEMQEVAAAVGNASRVFPTGIYIIWHPIKSTVPAIALAGELATAGVRKLLSLTLDIGLTDKTSTDARLTASGLMVINPPFGFESEMCAAQDELLPLLSRSPTANTKLHWLAGGP